MSESVQPAPEDEIATLFRLGLGPYCLKLVGKVPASDTAGWRTATPVDEATVREWIDIGFNVGLKTGIRSGIVVIDSDQARHPDGPQDFVPPPSGLRMRSSTGSVHHYYRAPTPCIGNSSSVLAPFVDVRGEGGYVVMPPSVHPVSMYPYKWEATGEPGVLPPEIVAALTPRVVAVDLTRESAQGSSNGTGYAEKALSNEVGLVRSAREGTRNTTLNNAAIKLGGLVAGGALSEDRVRSELHAAALAVGLEESETVATIRSGMTAGARTPRQAPVHPRGAQAPTPTHVPRESPDVLVPGSHIVPGGEIVEQGNHLFAAQVLSRIEPGAIYRRASVLGEIHDATFAPITANRIRSIVDESVRLTAGKESKEEGEPVLVFRTCNHDQASVILDYGQVRGEVRELRHLATYPVCVGQDFVPARPGWNPDHGVFLTCATVPKPLPLDEACAVLEDLVADFPFARAADRANFFGLLLTPVLRPALNEPVPMHLINSPIERTGKTKLAEIVLGVTVAGRLLPAMQLGEREEEREKKILSVLLRGQTLLHLDNLRDFIDSPSLASLLTSSEFQGRLLGQSMAPTLPNGLTVVGTGNNVHATGEIAKRIVPILLMPESESPESRTDFRHPDLLGYVHSARERVQAALLGLVAAWRDAGRPLHRGGFGGFERWTAVMGGIMGVAGYGEWLSNMAEWRGAADDSGSEHRMLVTACHAKWGSTWTPAADVYALAVELDLYGFLDAQKTDRARRTSFGMKVLNRLANRVIRITDGPSVRVETTGVGNRRLVRMERTA